MLKLFLRRDYIMKWIANIKKIGKKA
ncbi:MAG: PTS sorbitol transporter subunit IIA, partial [Lactobacillus crispatus]|nr:PTS sorbitol transporter subunit IIA [Lactobacillus crispatus]